MGLVTHLLTSSAGNFLQVKFDWEENLCKSWDHVSAPCILVQFAYLITILTAQQSYFELETCDKWITEDIYRIHLNSNVN